MPTERPDFESREQLLRWYRERYPMGTDFAEIRAQEQCQPDGGRFVVILPARGQQASRHYVGEDGRPGSRAVRQQWHVWFDFDGDLKLQGIEAELVSRR